MSTQRELCDPQEIDSRKCPQKESENNCRDRNEGKKERRADNLTSLQAVLRNSN